MPGNTKTVTYPCVALRERVLTEGHQDLALVGEAIKQRVQGGRIRAFEEKRDRWGKPKCVNIRAVDAEQRLVSDAKACRFDGPFPLGFLCSIAVQGKGVTNGLRAASLLLERQGTGALAT